MPLDLANKEFLLKTVVALVVDAKRDKITQADLAHILRPPITALQTPQGDILFESNRSQLGIQIRQSRVEIKDYSDRPTAGKPLVDYLAQLVTMLDGNVSSVGLNAHFSIPMVDESVGAYLASRLLDASKIEKGFKKGKVMGFGGVINFELLDDGSKWNLHLEERASQIGPGNLFVGLNHSLTFDGPLSLESVVRFEEQRSVDMAELESWLSNF